MAIFLLGSVAVAVAVTVAVAVGAQRHIHTLVVLTRLRAGWLKIGFSCFSCRNRRYPYVFVLCKLWLVVVLVGLIPEIPEANSSHLSGSALSGLFQRSESIGQKDRHGFRFFPFMHRTSHATLNSGIRSDGACSAYEEEEITKSQATARCGHC